MKPHLPAVLLTVLLLAASASPVRAASVTLRVDALESGTGFFDNTSGDHNLSSTPTFPSDSFSYTGPTVSVAHSAAVGQLNALVQNDIFETPSYSESAFVSTSVRWDDMMTISAAGLAGQAGTFTLQVVLDSTASYITDPGQTFSFTIGYGANGASGGGMLYNALGNLPHNLSGQVYSLPVPFTFGTPFSVFASMGLNDFLSSGQISEGQSAQFYGEAELRWGGIPQVLDAGNQPVANFTVTSDSGFNYANPVPEPSAALALGFGGMVLLLHRPRWRRVG